MASKIVSVVNGRATEAPPAGTLTSTNPSRLADPVAEVVLASTATFAAACAAAKQAQPSWGDIPAPVRGRAITAIGRIVEANKESLARLVTRELGKPHAESLGEVQEIIDTCDFFLGEGRRLYGQTVPSEMPDKQLFTFRVPVGEQLLVGHLARNGLAVEAAPLAEEEVAGVDDLLNLAQRLGMGLAKLTGDQAGQGFLVGLDDAADSGDRPAAHRGRNVPPRGLRLFRCRACRGEGGGTGEDDLGDWIRKPRRVGRGQRASGGSLGGAAVDNRNDLARHVCLSFVACAVAALSRVPRPVGRWPAPPQAGRGTARAPCARRPIRPG